MVTRSARWRRAAIAAAAASCLQSAAAAGFADVLDSPSQASALAPRSILQSITKAGTRLVAVGQRGHILVSTDSGRTWSQARVPVSSDLTSVFFAGERRGWAVGHDGVILHSDDAGASWKVQLTGRAMKQGADKPFLDVWFADEKNGFAVGAYNLVMRTSDGGATWESWSDRTDNPREFNLHAIRPAAGALYIAGESGLVLKLDENAQRFRPVATPYNGSYFGVVDAGTRVLAFGLRGNAYASGDGGRSWERVDAKLPASIVAGTRSHSGEVLLADAAGRIAVSADGARTFALLPLKQSVPAAGLAVAPDGHIAIAGPRGVAAAQVSPR